jgi:hypothetical protein
MSSISEYTIRVNNRDFILAVVAASNGHFISITEGDSHRIGALSVSVSTPMGPSITRVIPSKYSGVFLDLLAQRVASIVKGICIASLYVKSELDDECMRYILESIIERIGRK